MYAVDCGGVFTTPVPSSLIPLRGESGRLDLLSWDGRVTGHVTAVERVLESAPEGEAERVVRILALQEGASEEDILVQEGEALYGQCAEVRFGRWVSGMPIYVGVVALVWPGRILLCTVSADPHHSAFEAAVEAFKHVVPSELAELLAPAA